MHNFVFFLCLNIDDKHFDNKHIFLGLGKVCCLFIKIICDIISIFSLFFMQILCKKQGGEQLTLLMYAGYFECLGFEPFASLINHNCQWLSQVDCILCNYVFIFTKDQF